MKQIQAIRQKTALFLFLATFFNTLYADEKNHHTLHSHASGLEVQHGWVRLTPPVAKNTVAYFVLHNSGDQAVTVVGVDASIAESAAMHDTLIEQSMVRMVHLDQLTIAAGDNIAFAPGGKHLMLKNLRQPLTQAKPVVLHFQLHSGEVVTARLPVQRQAGSHHHGDHVM